MVLSAAERKRRQEKEDAEPYLFLWLSWGVFRQMPLRKQQEVRQRFTQAGATHVGFWKDCTLSKCRRARRCTGFLTEAQYGNGYNPAYPPCARNEEWRRAKILYEGLNHLYPPDDEPGYAGSASDRGETG